VTKEQLIELIEKTVPDGCEIGLVGRFDEVVTTDLGIANVRATKPKRKNGHRHLSDKATTSLYVIGDIVSLPINKSEANQTAGYIEAISTKVPICEECGVEMERYEDAADTGKGGYACPDCGWSQDDV